MRKKPLTDEEKRAVDKSLGTTATTYVAPTAQADGVSNFGVFIQTKVLGDLLEEDRDISPVLRDAILYRVKGLTEFPYRKQRTTANKKVEGKAVADATWVFGTVEGKKGYLQSILKITDEVMSLSDEDLGQYVISLMNEDMREDFATELIYGDGTTASGNTPARIEGISHGATAITANKATIFEDLVKALDSVQKRYRKGAQFYVSEEVFSMLRTAKDSEGHYIYDVTRDTPITILGRPVEVEPNLVANAVLVGNIKRYYKGNLLKDVTIERDKDISTQIHTFVASAFACCAPVPGAFAYGVVSTTAPANSGN
jgi:HK97 family phage major capsid protein